MHLNLAGYRAGHGPSGERNRHTFGGLSDAAFRMVPLLESARDADWPWAARRARQVPWRPVTTAG